LSSPFTAAFLAAWRNTTARRPVTLAKIDITSPSALTLYVGSAEIFTPDGQFWEWGLQGGTIRDSGDFLGTGPDPADTTIRLANRRYAFQTSGKIGDSLRSYQWQGATVTIYFWERSLTDIADLARVYQGTVDSLALADDYLTLNLLQPRTWNKSVPTTVVDKATYPNAPDASQGLPIPILYGDFSAPPLRAPHTSSYGTNKQRQEESGAGQSVVPLVLVDPGTGAANVKLVGACHALTDLYDASNGRNLFVDGGDVLAVVDSAGLTETLGASESYVTVNDDAMIAYYGVRPVDVRTGGGNNTALNPRRAMDVFDETTYATLDQGAGYTALELQLPSASRLGFISAVDVICCYSGDAANANNLRVYPRNPVAGSSGTAVSVAATGTTPTILSGSWDSAWWSQNWDFGGFASSAPDRTTIDVRVDFSGGATNKARIYWVALRVKYRPQRNLVTPEHNSYKVVGLKPRNRGWGGFAPVVETTTTPAEYAVDSQFFSNLKGYADDGGGTYTGSAGSLIELAPDIAQHFLATYGNQSSFENGTGAFGSFAEARGKLANGSPNNFKMAVRVDSITSVQAVLQEIARQSLSCVIYDRFTGKWLFHVWKPGDSVDYDLVFDRTDCPDLFEPSLTSDVDITQGVRIKYGFDWFKNRTMYEAFVTANGSSQGYNLPTVRDQKLTITAGVNDYLDWAVATTAAGHAYTATYADQLTAATYTPDTLAQHIQTKMRTHRSSVFVRASYNVIAGWNDKLDFSVGASVYAATLSEGKYNGNTLAAEMQRALNAAGSGVNWIVGYNPTLARFTVYYDDTAVALLIGTGTNYATSGWANITCLNGDWPAGSSSFAANSVYADRFRIQLGNKYSASPLDPSPPYFSGMKLLFNTGTHASATCANVIGWSTAADVSFVATLTQLQGTYARGDREATAAASEALYGPKPDVVLTATWIRDESSAQQLRDRRFDFGSTSQVMVKFRTHRAPDLQRMRVIAVSSDMDARRPYVKYGSDGSWSGKALRVIEVEQDLGPSYHTEVMAMEA